MAVAPESRPSPTGGEGGVRSRVAAMTPAARLAFGSLVVALVVHPGHPFAVPEMKL